MKPTFLTAALAVALVVVGGDAAVARCLLGNPGFELGGAAGSEFGVWNQFGSIGRTLQADHGQSAAVVRGPNQGGWGVSAFWQSLDTSPGEQWVVAVRVSNDAGQPLTGASTAIVNIEWRDAADGLIRYESHVAADASSPTDTWLDFSVVSGPAPAGAESVRLLLGVLQAPAEPSPAVHYDTATFYNLTSPTIHEQQFADFSGGRVVDFAGYSWRVKGDGFFGPGPNQFSDDPTNVWVDGEGSLHLAILRQGSTWTSSEVALEEALGYGDYIFTTKGRLDLLDPHAVLGLFLWQYGPCWSPDDLWWNPYNEIDIEFSRWGDPVNDIAHFTTQPWDWPGNGVDYDATFAEEELSSHAFRWLPDRVEYRSWRGGAAAESPATMLHEWTYSGPHVPRPEQPRVHLNLWYIFAEPSSYQEVLIADFRFTPAETATAIWQDAAPVLAAAPGRLFPATPNPFNPRTEIRFALDQGARVDLAVYDLAGRRVQTLLAEHVAAGEHALTWDGRDGNGRAQASGVYLVRLWTMEFTETRKLTLLK